MHSSRMRAVRSSSRLLGGGVSASVHAGIHTPSRPGPGPSPPPGLGLETPHLLPGYGPGDPPLPPCLCLPVYAWRPPPRQTPPNLPPGMGLETPAPVDRQTRVKT